MTTTFFTLLFLLIRVAVMQLEVDKNNIVDQKAELKFISFLSEEIKESSGLAYFNKLLVTHNDSGNENILYVFDKENGRVQNRFKIADVKNVDWEDLAQNEDFIFIGDIGNNDGNRKDLKIYKIKKDNLKLSPDIKIEADEIIEFQYADQSDFTQKKKHNYDSEAIIYFKNHLYLFSKNREGSLCNVYKIPSKSGKYKAEIIDSFNISGLITGAAIAPSASRIILTGYNKDEACFLYSLENFKEDKFFSGKNTKITLGSYKKLGQMEAVIFEDENNILITSEKTKDQKPNIFKLNLGAI